VSNIAVQFYQFYQRHFILSGGSVEIHQRLHLNLFAFYCAIFCLVWFGLIFGKEICEGREKLKEKFILILNFFRFVFFFAKKLMNL
jgi:hypothetical protein